MSGGFQLTWEEIVCGLIIVLPFAVAAVLLGRVRKKPIRAADLWTPCWRGIHPLFLCIYRGFVFVFMSVWVLRFALADGISSFFFYTQWTFTLVIVYFAIATCISINGCWTYSKESSKIAEESDRFLNSDLESNNNNPSILDNSESKIGKDRKEAGFWGYSMQIIYQISGGAVFLTDIVFWGLLVPFFYSGTSIDLMTDGMHSLNALFLLIDTALNCMNFPWYRMAYFVFWSSAYIVFQWVSHACGLSWWPYPFLELATPWAPMWYLAMALVHIPCYYIYWMIVKAKNNYFPRFFPHSYVKLI
ncbi:hypothetical protein LUZ60_014116 [Juncus effusus]|nr:hypothetical protein LUZ60_014116 [Juncus effusus]